MSASMLIGAFFSFVVEAKWRLSDWNPINPLRGICR
jgi:hypothetical protein